MEINNKDTFKQSNTPNMKPQSTKHLFARTVMPVNLLKPQLYCSPGSNMKFLFALGPMKVIGQPSLRMRSGFGARAPELILKLNCAPDDKLNY